MKEFIYPEMMVHIPVCTHKEPKNVLVISNENDAIVAELARHKEISVKTIPSSDALAALRDIEDGSVDIVMSETDSDAAVSAHINRVLNDKGILVCNHPGLAEVEANKTLLGVLGNYFKILMPYNVGTGETLLLGSKEYHPTADVILHRTDMLEGQSYYNCDIHPAAFAMPNYIRKEYFGIIKN